MQHKVGRYLFHGERDRHFVTAVEWTGRPQLAEAVMTRTYRLSNEHLVHVNNVDTQWPVRVRIRVPSRETQPDSGPAEWIPQMAIGGLWTVRDAVGDLYYTRDGSSALWSTDDLIRGVVVALEARSDLFLLIAPAAGDAKVNPLQLIRSRDFGVLPDHQAASTGAGPVQELPLPSVVRDNASEAFQRSGRLVCTATEPMGFLGAEGGMTLGNAIRTVKADGGSGRRLRQLRGHLWSPCYAPDGKKIAFVHDSGGCGQIFVMSEDGSNVVNLSSNNFCDRNPVWSPDGTRIAFLSERKGDWDIFTMNADGSGQRRVAGNPGVDRAVAWSPDGTGIAWESQESGMPTIWACNSDGSNSRPLIWPDKPLKYQRAEQWATEAPVPLRDIERTFPDETHYLTCPVWSPDGTRIAAVKDGRGGHGSYPVIIQADGSSMLRVNQDKVACSGNLSWSPDGTRLAGTFRCPKESERAGIFVLVGDGRPERLVLVEATPKGPRLGGARRHGLMSFYSHGSAQPGRVVKTFSSLRWSPDGKTLAFTSDMHPSGAFYVYTVDSAGGEPQRLDLTRSAWPNEIAWRPG